MFHFDTNALVGLSEPEACRRLCVGMMSYHVVARDGVDELIQPPIAVSYVDLWFVAGAVSRAQMHIDLVKR